MANYLTPGVYREDLFEAPTDELQTGVPIFLGYTRAEKATGAEAGQKVAEVNRPQRLTHRSQFESIFGAPLSDGYLGEAVNGFFENGGRLCYVVRLLDRDDTTPTDALRAGLEAMTSLETIDLVCVPDIMWTPTEATVLQQIVLDHCDKLGDRFAILDSIPNANVTAVQEQRQALHGTNGALYFPWISTGDRTVKGELRYVPPSGHVAGVYARTDQRVGVHKAPANEVLEGVQDLKSDLNQAQQDQLNPVGINCLRAFPGRGIRVWGVRTLSHNPAWTYINVRRLFLTAGRWMERSLAGVIYEPNDPKLWARIHRDLTAYFRELFQQGALKGRTAREAFYIKCDAETNAPDVREAGTIVTEIGLAPAIPNEFVVVRIMHGASGVTISGPSRPV